MQNVDNELPGSIELESLADATRLNKLAKAVGFWNLKRNG